MIGRIILSILVLVGVSIVETFLIPTSTLMAGKLAGMQFQSSDSAYVVSTVGMNFVTHLAIPGFIVMLLLGSIWYGPLKKLFTTAALSILALGLVLHTDAKAYYDQKDFTEAYTILPNWSAFWIPDAGDNKSDQAQMDSAAYLEKNKVAAKRFVIPHTKLSGTGSFWDFFVPAGRLILVDRTTYSHEWVDAVDRGDNTKKDGFPCQSTEGLNIAAGVSVGAKVEERDAATFLYNFGVTSNQQSKGGVAISDPQVIFQSVYYGRSLKEVMADIGRKKIQTLVCNEIGSRTFDQTNKDTVKIMQAVEKSAGEYFKSVGITISFIGWADTFNFDHEVQLAVNRGFIANIEMVNAQKLQPYAATIQALASADALRSFGQKSDGKFPTTVVGAVPDLNTMFGTFLTPTKGNLIPGVPAPVASPTTQK